MVRPFFGLLFLTAFSAQAQSVYKWIDEAGTTHYTDNPATIPRGVQVFATDGAPLSSVGSSDKKPAEPAKKAEAPVVAAAPQKRDPNLPTESELYWRGQFKAAHDKIHGLEDQIAADEKRAGEVNGLVINYAACGSGYGWVQPVNGATTVGTVAVGPNGVRGGFGFNAGQRYVAYPTNCLMVANPEYERLRDRLELSKRQLIRAKDDLAELERRASYDAVPLEWRR